MIRRWIEAATATTDSRIFLEADDDRDLDRVSKVIYHLHPTFYDPERTVTERKTNFELRTAGWGMFDLSAEVYLAGRQKPINLTRYLNF